MNISKTIAAFAFASTVMGGALLAPSRAHAVQLGQGGPNGQAQVDREKPDNGGLVVQNGRGDDRLRTFPRNGGTITPVFENKHAAKTKSKPARKSKPHR